MRLWRSRVDCWYEPHRDPGQKPKAPKRIVRWVLVEAENSEAAIKAALDWADSTASPTQGRVWLKFEHRQTGSITLPLDCSALGGRRA